MIPIKTKLILATKGGQYVIWTSLPFIPRISEHFNVQDLLLTKELDQIKSSANKWSGSWGTIKSIEYRHDDNDFYVESLIWCEDSETLF